MEQTQLQAVWEQILTKMKETLAESAFKWFKSVKPISLTATGLVLSAQNDLVKDWITSHYLTIIEDAVGAVLGSKRKVDFLVLPSVQPEPEPEPAKPEKTPTAPKTQKRQKRQKKQPATAAARRKTPIRGRSSRSSRPHPSTTATCTSSRQATARR